MASTKVDNTSKSGKVVLNRFDMVFNSIRVKLAKQWMCTFQLQGEGMEVSHCGWMFQLSVLG